MIDSQTTNQVTTITLNRPEKLNAFAGTMREDLVAALSAASRDAGVRAVIITGAGRAFCAGGDVEFMAGLQKRGDVTAFTRLLEAGREIVTLIHEMPKFVIAAVNGVAAGAGCNLALACDYRIGSEFVRFSESFVRIGMHPDWGGTWFLPRLIGSSRAMEMLLSGRMVGSAEALTVGLVDRLVPAGELIETAEKVAAAIVAGPRIPLAGIKRAIYESAVNPLSQQIDLETRNQLEAFGSRDAAEGMSAFFEKRTPRFDGS